MKMIPANLAELMFILAIIYLLWNFRKRLVPEFGKLVDMTNWQH